MRLDWTTLALQLVSQFFCIATGAELHRSLEDADEDRFCDSHRRKPLECSRKLLITGGHWNWDR